MTCMYFVRLSHTCSGGCPLNSVYMCFKNVIQIQFSLVKRTKSLPKFRHREYDEGAIKGNHLKTTYQCSTCMTSSGALVCLCCWSSPTTR